MPSGKAGVPPVPRRKRCLTPCGNAVAPVLSGQDGQWDFALVDNSAPEAITYCFRVVKSDGTTVDTYTVIPELTTKTDRVPRNSGTLGSPAIY